MKDKKSMDREAAARIQSAEAKKNSGEVEAGGFAPRAQSAAERNARDDDDYPDTSQWMPDFD